MAGNINKVILIGHLGCDPTMANAQSVEHAAQAAGEIVVSFSLLTTESWVDRKSGARRERTEWHHIAIFNQRLADVAFRYLRKGSKVYIEGHTNSAFGGPERATARHNRDRAVAAPRRACHAWRTPAQWCSDRSRRQIWRARSARCS